MTVIGAAGATDLELDLRTDQPPQQRVHARRRRRRARTAAGCVAWRRLKASSCRVSPAPRCTDSLISVASSRAGSSGPSCIRSRSADPMMLMRMLLKSCATPPASRPMASSFCDCRSCSSRARRSVMSRTKPGHHATGSRSRRGRPSIRHGNSRAVRVEPGQLELPRPASGPRPVAMYWLKAARRRVAVRRRQQHLDVPAEDVVAQPPEHPLGGGVELADVQLLVDRDDRVVRRLENRALARLALDARRGTPCRSDRAAPP